MQQAEMGQNCGTLGRN